ncbi:MAG: FAD-dependent oxidoreductase [Bacteroidales bacterium]|nr:FAD-dependent oxidoreductase [Bacteroidales bacterium]
MVNDRHLFSLNIPDSKKPRIVILGGGFGGINMVKKLCDDFQVVLLDRYNYHTFQPLLYQVATAGLEPDSIAGPLRKIMAKKNNFYFRMLSAVSVSPENNTIATTIGELAYDYLVIATGAKVNFFNNHSISEHAFPLKQVTHALDLRSHIFQQFERLQVLKNNHQKAALLNFVVVGAGPTGVEVCGALAELKSHVLQRDYPELNINNVKIHLIEGLDRVLPGMSEKSGKMAYKYLRKSGTDVKLNCLTEHYDGEVVKLNNGQEIKTSTLIWAAGVKGNIIQGFGEQSIHKEKLLVNDINQVIRNTVSNKAYANILP